MSRIHHARLERIENSPQFTQGRFRNPTGASANVQPGEMGPVVSEFVFGARKRSPRSGLRGVDPRETWGNAAPEGFRVTWLGHSTLFVEMDGVTFLTDPVWERRASPVRFAGPKRFQDMVVPIDAMPRVDVVLVSHDHYDHLDRMAVTKLAHQGAQFVVTLGVGGHLERWGIPTERITELDWWEHHDVRGVRVTSAPTQHFSGRGVSDRNSTLWGSFVLESDRHKFYFGADSGLGDHFSKIGEKFGKFDVITLEIGAFHPAWGDIHMGPDNAWRARDMIGSGAFLPIHWGTFDLAVHAWQDPPERVLEAANGRELWLPRMGEPLDLVARNEPTPWWREAL